MRHAASLLIVAFAATIVPATASAHTTYHHHRHHHYRPAPPPPPPARHVQQPKEEKFLLGLGIRASGIALEGHKLHIDDIENPVMGGVGIQFRSMFSQHWGLEFAVDYLRADTDNFTQTTVPVSLSALLYLFPETRINPYGLFGMGVHFTKLDYERSWGSFEHDMIEWAGHVGLGLQIRLTRHFALHSDVRFMGVYKNLSEKTEIRDDWNAAGGIQEYPGIDDDDRFNVGLQFQAGATYFF